MFEKLSLDIPIMFVCGYAGSGKSFYAQVLAEALDANFVEVSDIVKGITKKKLRSDICDMPELDEQIIEAIQEMEKPLVVSGARQDTITQAFPNSTVVWVKAPKDVREKRIKKRASKKDDMSLKDCDDTDRDLGLDGIYFSLLEEF